MNTLDHGDNLDILRRYIPDAPRDLRGVVAREKAAMGFRISLEAPSKPMRTEAAGAGVYASPGWGQNYARLQILTIADLLSGKRIDMPPIGQVNVTFKKAPKAQGKKGEQGELGLATTIAGRGT